MNYKLFIVVNTFNEFKNIKLSSSSTNTTYITYENPLQTYGTPDVLWNQIVFVEDSHIIYTKGTIYSNYIKPTNGIPVSDLSLAVQSKLLPTITSSDNGKILIVNNSQWSLALPSTLYSGTSLPNDNYGRNGDIYIQTEEQEEQEES